MSLRKILNLICIGLCLLLIIDLFLPIQEYMGISDSYWGENEHTVGIMLLLEFLGAAAFFALYQFNMVKDNKFSLLFQGHFLGINLLSLIYMMKGELDYVAYGYWIGLLCIVALISLTLICNVVSDQPKPKRPRPYNGGGYGGPVPPYNMYNQPPMGYNNYR